MSFLIWGFTMFGSLMAHQVPSLTVEAFFLADRSYTLNINLDPRLILSEQPSSLPPVSIEWYRSQNPDEQDKTKNKACEYLRRFLTLHFGTETTPIKHCEIMPMDGANNMPLSDETKEVHLLAKVKGKAPSSQNQFSLFLSEQAGVSLILLNSFEGTSERRPNVVFPGESSRIFELAFETDTAKLNQTTSEQKGKYDLVTNRMLLSVVVGVLSILVFYMTKNRN